MEKKFICKCGKEFKSLSSLISHGGHCELYETKINKESKYKNGDNYKCECGREFTNSQSLNGHFSHCKTHRECIGKDASNKYFNIRNHIGEMSGWDNFSDEDKKNIYKKSRETYNKKIKDGVIKPSFMGKTHTEETKQMLREKQAKQSKILLENGYTINYNPLACKFIDELNKKYNWFLQHAENGGEVECCGYYLDGYDKINNIAFEYDEPKHYKNGNLRECDIQKQNRIIKKLKCKFYRYNEKTNTLYCVN